MFKKKQVRDLIFVSVAARLGKVSGILFISGFIVGKLQYIPFAVFSAALNIISLILYGLGYGVWLIGSQFQPTHKVKQEEWYGFDEFKKQYLFAATIGLVASVSGIVAVFFPILLIPSSWLFLCSNLMWSTGEYHKYKSPPDDENYSGSYQKSYVSFAVTMTLISFFAALGTTIALLFPPAAFGAIGVTVIICLGLGVLAGEFWLDFNFGNHKKDSETQHSYQLINKSMDIRPQSELSNDLEPKQSKSLFVHQSTVTEDLLKIEPDEARQTCTWSP